MSVVEGSSDIVVAVAAGAAGHLAVLDVADVHVVVAIILVVHAQLVAAAAVDEPVVSELVHMLDLHYMHHLDSAVVNRRNLFVADWRELRQQ